MTTSESSLGSSSKRSLDSSSPSSSPSCKRCRPPTASVPSSTHVSRSIAPTPADLLPPRKSKGVVAYLEDGVGMGFEITASYVREDDEEFEAEASAADTRVIRFDLDRTTEIDTTQRQLEASYIERDRIDSLRWHMAVLHEEFRQVRRDRDDTRRRLRRGKKLWLHHEMTPCCQYSRGLRIKSRTAVMDDNGNDSLKFTHLNFKGTEGVVGLIRWFEKMETVFHISNCPEKYQVKYATCTLLNSALTWWNSHKRTIGTEAAFAMSMERGSYKLMTENNDLAAYTQRFQKLTMMCTTMVLEEEDRVKKFIRGLPDNIQRNVIVVEPTRLQDAIRIANNLMDQKLKGYAVKNAKNKRRFFYVKSQSRRKNHSKG
ncbi:hypothetical protein Tco_0024150 [Tanacetum coccineum]